MLIALLLLLILMAICGTLGKFLGGIGQIIGLTMLMMFFSIQFDLHIALSFIASLVTIFVGFVGIELIAQHMAKEK